MESIFIPNTDKDTISKTILNSLKYEKKKTLDNLRIYNWVNNSKTAFLLENGAPISMVKKVIK